VGRFRQDFELEEPVLHNDFKFILAKLARPCLKKKNTNPTFIDRESETQKREVTYAKLQS
jgi:hypothetical protein